MTNPKLDGEGMPTEREWLEGTHRDAHPDAGPVARSEGLDGEAVNVAAKAVWKRHTRKRWTGITNPIQFEYIRDAETCVTAYLATAAPPDEGAVVERLGQPEILGRPKGAFVGEVEPPPLSVGAPLGGDEGLRDALDLLTDGYGRVEHDRDCKKRRAQSIQKAVTPCTCGTSEWFERANSFLDAATAPPPAPESVPE